MFDLFGGASATEVNEANQAHTAHNLMLVFVLLEKGIVTEEELESARVRAVQFVEQEWARKREESLKEFDEKHPGVRKMFGALMGTDPTE